MLDHCRLNPVQWGSALFCFRSSTKQTRFPTFCCRGKEAAVQCCSGFTEPSSGGFQPIFLFLAPLSISHPERGTWKSPFLSLQDILHCESLSVFSRVSKESGFLALLSQHHSFICLPASKICYFFLFLSYCSCGWLPFKNTPSLSFQAAKASASIELWLTYSYSTKKKCLSHS